MIAFGGVVQAALIVPFPVRRWGAQRDAPAAAPLADALRRATGQGAKDVRERRAPRWEAVREALERWDEEDERRGRTSDPVVRNGADLLLESLEEFSRALDAGAGDRPGTSGAGRS